MSWRDDLSCAISNAQHDQASGTEVVEAFNDIMELYFPDTRASCIDE